MILSLGVIFRKVARAKAPACLSLTGLTTGHIHVVSFGVASDGSGVEMFRKATWASGIVSFLPLVTLSQSVPDISQLPMTVVAEQKDATLHFNAGSIASIGGTGSDFNGFTATSADMGGGQLRTVILLDQNVPDEKAATLASFQGRLEGTVKCKRIRRGDSPNAPNVHVLADGCSIVSINH